MRRRHLLASILTFCATPLTGQGQQARVYRLAWLSGTAIAPGAVWTAFVDGMRELGWIEGQNFTVENLRYEGHSERLSALAAEVVQRQFDLIICAGTLPAVTAKDATTTIPIVFYFVGDPVGAGLVASLARPGGNITGLGGLGPGVYGKMLELLLAAAPTATRIAMLSNSTFALHANFAADAESAARRLKLTLKPVELRTPDDVDGLRDDCARQAGRAADPRSAVPGRSRRTARQNGNRATVARHRSVRTGRPRRHSHVLRCEDPGRCAAAFVLSARILKGASPGTLPVEQPSRFYLTINLRTAKAIGLGVPSSLLQRADLLIE